MKKIDRNASEALKNEIKKGHKQLNKETICCFKNSLNEISNKNANRTTINLNDYIPNHDTPISFICVNLHIFQDSTGQNNYNISHIKNFKDIFNWINNFYENKEIPNYLRTCNSKPQVNQQIDSRIRFVLNRIEFYNDDALCNQGAWNFSPLVNAMLLRDPNMDNQLNIFLTDPDQPQPATGYTQLPSSNLNFKQYIHTFRNRANPEPSFFLSQHWAHELGHVLGLTHTYNGVVCDENDPFFIYDIHGCGSSKICPIPQSTLNNNNLMGGKESWSISTIQIAKMHYSLQNLSVFKYVNSCCIPNCIAFSAQGNNHVSLGNDLLLEYSNLILNEGWCWNGSEFIAPFDGVYTFSINFVKDSYSFGGTEDDVNIVLYKNQISIGNAWSGEGGGKRVTGVFQVNLKLERGDKVFTKVHSDNGRKRHLAYYIFNGHLICTKCN